MANEDNNKQGFKINDKRRFDSDGNDKGDPTQTVSKPKSEPIGEIPSADREVAMTKDKSKAVNFIQSSADEASYQIQSEINFTSFVMSLATQALVQLGEMAPPTGMTIEVDPVAAKQTIDILHMFKDKTKGNLDEKEDKIIEEILHTLRVSYLRSV